MSDLKMTYCGQGRSCSPSVPHRAVTDPWLSARRSFLGSWAHFSDNSHAGGRTVTVTASMANSFTVTVEQLQAVMDAVATFQSQTTGQPDIVAQAAALAGGLAPVNAMRADLDRRRRRLFAASSSTCGRR